MATAALIAATLVSAVGSVYGGYVQAQGAKAQAEAQANAAEYEADASERNRRAALQQSQVHAESKRRDNRRKLASVKAAYGAAGIDLAGSPLDVLEDTAADQELDAKAIEYQGDVRAAGYSDDIALKKAEAVNARRAGKTAATAALIGGITSGVSGIASAGGTLMRAA